METNYSRPGAQLANAEAALEAYDSWIRWANDGANQLYANRAIAGITSSIFEAVVRLHHVDEAMVASAIFSNLWPALGLPPAGQLLMLRDGVA